MRAAPAGHPVPMANLVLGPLLRYVTETEATVWVETDAPCEVEVLGRASRPSRSRSTTTRWSGSKASSRAPHEYEVALDGERRLAAPIGAAAEHDPDPRREPARSTSPSGPAGSLCRTSAPYMQSADRDAEGSSPTRSGPRPGNGARATASWPELLFLLGDQVYVDEGSPRDAGAESAASAAAPARRRARRWPTSRSTPGSTARAGASR